MKKFSVVIYFDTFINLLINFLFLFQLNQFISFQYLLTATLLQYRTPH